MKRSFVAALMVLAAFVQPVRAEEQAYEPSVARMQSVLADVGAWTQEYQEVMARSSEPLLNISVFTGILDRFVAREITADRAVTDIVAWRSDSLARLREGQAAAEALRPPPSLSILGPRGDRLQTALNATRDNALPTIHEFERVVNAAAELGLSALQNPEKGYEARERALFQASIQLVRVDRGRIDITLASLPEEHPNHAVMAAVQHYYDTLVAIPEYALEELEGRGDRAMLVAALREDAGNMRSELDRADISTRQSIERFRALQGGEAVALVRSVVALLETFPASIQAYRGLAEGVDRAALALERGDDVRDVWANQEESDAPYLLEIDRLERLRASLMANNGGRL